MTPLLRNWGAINIHLKSSKQPIDNTKKTKKTKNSEAAPR
jgi:hypothetical protein